MNLESANLILRTSSVIVGTNKNATNSSITWADINLRNLLGVLYYKYKRFKICLTSFGNVNTGAIAAAADRTLLLNLRGFQWENQTFDSITNTNRDAVIMSTITVASANGVALNYTGEIGWVFLKPDFDTISINISFTRATDNGINSAINYGDSVFCFSIYGVDE